MADVRAIARLSQIRERFKKAMNMKIITDKSGHGFQFRLPGFKYDDFDRAGHVTISKLNRIIETTRFTTAGILGFTTVDSTRSIFVFGNHATISPTLNEKASINLPMIYDSRAVNMGTSTLDVCQRIFIDPNPGAPNHEFISKFDPSSLLFSYVFRFVALDRKAQKSVAFKDEEREQIKKLIKSSPDAEALPEFPRIDLPDSPPQNANSFTIEVQPRYSDMDAHFHINQGVYLDYASECAARACVAGALSKFGSEDICFRTVLSASNLYSAESFATEKLKVTVWEDEVNPSTTLLFAIQKINGAPVYKSRFVYNAPEK